MLGPVLRVRARERKFHTRSEGSFRGVSGGFSVSPFNKRGLGLARTSVPEATILIRNHAITDSCCYSLASDISDVLLEGGGSAEKAGGALAGGIGGVSDGILKPDERKSGGFSVSIFFATSAKGCLKKC